MPLGRALRQGLSTQHGGPGGSPGVGAWRVVEDVRRTRYANVRTPLAPPLRSFRCSPPKTTRSSTNPLGSRRRRMARYNPEIQRPPVIGRSTPSPLKLPRLHQCRRSVLGPAPREHCRPEAISVCPIAELRCWANCRRRTSVVIGSRVPLLPRGQCWPTFLQWPLRRPYSARWGIAFTRWRVHRPGEKTIGRGSTSLIPVLLMPAGRAGSRP